MQTTTGRTHSTATSKDSDVDPQVAISVSVGIDPASANIKRIIDDARKAQRSWVNGSDFVDHVDVYGFSILNDKALEALKAVTEPMGHRVLSVCTGLGYAEAQMVASGMEVTGFDKRVPATRWLLDTHDSSAGIPYSRFSDRALFISFPEPTKGASAGGASFPVEVIKDFIKAGGSTVIVITEARATGHAIKCDRALVEFLETGTRIGEEVALTPWPVVTCFTGYGHTYHTFEPVLKAYRFSPK